MPKVKPKKVVYLSGPITGVIEYWKPFERADDALTRHDVAVLNPSALPKGMTNEQYMRICFSMIDSADLVLFLPGWQDSDGATLEMQHCMYTGKRRAFSIVEALSELEAIKK